MASPITAAEVPTHRFGDVGEENRRRCAGERPDPSRSSAQTVDVRQASLTELEIDKPGPAIRCFAKVGDIQPRAVIWAAISRARVACQRHRANSPDSRRIRVLCGLDHGGQGGSSAGPVRTVQTGAKFASMFIANALSPHNAGMNWNEPLRGSRRARPSSPRAGRRPRGVRGRTACGLRG